MCVGCGWFYVTFGNPNWGERISGRALWFWPHSSISTDSREFKAFSLLPGWDLRDADQRKRIQKRGWWEQSVFQLPASDKQGEMTAFWVQLIWTKNHLFISPLRECTHNLDMYMTYMPTLVYFCTYHSYRLIGSSPVFLSLLTIWAIPQKAMGVLKSANNHNHNICLNTFGTDGKDHSGTFQETSF